MFDLSLARNLIAADNTLLNIPTARYALVDRVLDEVSAIGRRMAIKKLLLINRLMQRRLYVGTGESVLRLNKICV